MFSYLIKVGEDEAEAESARAAMLAARTLIEDNLEAGVDIEELAPSIFLVADYLEKPMFQAYMSRNARARFHDPKRGPV